MTMQVKNKQMISVKQNNLRLKENSSFPKKRARLDMHEMASRPLETFPSNDSFYYYKQ